jgi:hypothetical protein
LIKNPYAAAKTEDGTGNEEEVSPAEDSTSDPIDDDFSPTDNQRSSPSPVLRGRYSAATSPTMPESPLPDERYDNKSPGAVSSSILNLKSTM